MEPEPNSDQEALRARIARLERENTELRALIAHGEGDAKAKRAGEEQLRLILDSATDYAIFTVDREGIVKTWNPGAERLLGFSEREIIGQNGRMLFTPEDQAAGEPEQEISTALSEGRAQDERWHIRKDGSRFWGSGLMLPLQAAGTPGLLKIMRDQTARHRAEEMNQLLIGEIKHRVKNTLALVQAIARETLRGRFTDRQTLDALDARLSALARSHDILAQEDWTSASLDEVIRRALTPFIAEERLADALALSGPAVRLPPNLAVSLGLCFHELATNATKYGALSVPGGRIEICWQQEPREEGGILRLGWRERNGPPVSPPQHKGFGSRLIERALAHEVGGTARLEYPPEGMHLQLSFPMTALQKQETKGI